MSQGPRAWPIAGHLPQFLNDKLGFLSHCVADYGATGRAVSLHIGEPTLLLTSADDVQHVLTGNAGNYTKTPRLTGRQGRLISGAGMHTSEGAEHLRQRRMLQPAFHPHAIEQFGAMMTRRISTHLNRWRDGDTLDASREMEALTLDIIIAAIFGEGFQDEGNRLAQAITVRRAYLEYQYRTLLPFPRHHPVPVIFAFRHARRVIDEAVARSRQQPQDDGFLAAYLGLRYPDGTAMSDALLRDEILTLSSTGYETVGEALTWTLYLLARHPEIESRVLDELRSGDRTYLRTVLDEAMRLYPPTWIYVRMAVAADRLPSGADVPAGTKLYLCQYTMHRQAAYFPDPEVFDPSRFSVPMKKERHRFAYFPFGFGRRVCIGEQFAIQEALEVLALLLPRFRCELPAGFTAVPQPGITLRVKGGLPMRVRARHP